MPNDPTPADVSRILVHGRETALELSPWVMGVCTGFAQRGTDDYNAGTYPLEEAFMLVAASAFRLGAEATREGFDTATAPAEPDAARP